MARPPITKARPFSPSRGSLRGRTFTTERGYRNALAKIKGFASFGEQQRQARRVRGPDDLKALTIQERMARDNALEALSLMRRRDFSLSKAARSAGTTPNTVRRYAGTALRAGPGGRLSAATSDRIYRRMRLVTPDGIEAIDVRDSRTATALAEYMAAARQYADSGDPSALRRFRNRTFRSQGQTYEFVTDLETLDALAAIGELSFEDLYQS